jgi:Transcription factor Iwr1
MSRTILRIKRRRTDEPLSYIRLQALNRPGELPLQLSNKKRPISNTDRHTAEMESHGLAQFLDHEGEEQSPVAPASVLWKRLEPNMEQEQSCRVLEHDDEEKEGRQTKRRKLTLLDTSEKRSSLGVFASRSGKQKFVLKVLDPLARLVDDSLQKVHMGDRPIAEHFRFVTTDPRLASSQNSKKWLQWCHSSGGNLLHACALWNDMEMTGELLQIPNLPSVLCEALDGDGRTPYEVAQLSGHDSVCEVMEAFGGDTTSFVYDMFCLEEGDTSAIEEDEDTPMTVEMTDGVAYWTPSGELMLETNDKISAYVDEEDDGEIDSNCEDYDANDYPDEEEEDFAWGYDDQGYDSVAVDDHNQESCALDRSYLQRHTRSSINAEEGNYGDDIDMMGGHRGAFGSMEYTTANDA